MLCLTFPHTLMTSKSAVVSCTTYFWSTENKKDVTHGQMIAVLRRCLDSLPLKESQPSDQGEPAAASLGGASAVPGSSDRHSKIQEEVEGEENLMMNSKDVEMECKHNENDASVDDKDERSAGDKGKSTVDKDDETESNDQSGSEDDEDMSACNFYNNPPPNTL